MAITTTRDYLIIHCAATKANQNIGSADIDKWHRAQGWSRCGYHSVIRRNGTTETAEGGFRSRPLDMAGSHVGGCGAGWNSRSFGVCLAGGIDDAGKPQDNFTEQQWKALEEQVLTWIEQFPTIEYLGGHRDLIAKTKASPKACPSFDVWEWWTAKVLPKYPDNTRFKSIKQVK